MDPGEEMFVGVALPSGSHAGEKAPPGFVIFVGIHFVWLGDVNLAVLMGLLDEGRLIRGQAGRLDDCILLGHTQFTRLYNTTT